jgi:hypothetical protein
MIKSMLKSKTLWCNALAFVILILQQFAITPAPIDPTTQGIILVALNFILRFFTNQPVIGK